MNSTLPLGDVAFYWRTKATPTDPSRDIPARLPFEFGFDPTYQLIIQRRNQEVLRWLGRVYRENANVGYLQEGHALAAAYGGEFLSFIGKALAQGAGRPMSVVDIGCGGVYLLRKLKEQGFHVCGIDPSPVTFNAGRAIGIEIIPEFYPSNGFSRRFDLIYHYDVLEHIVNPVEFLQAHHANLNAGGGIIIAVPDCTSNIEYGDIAMLLHEHLNYFDLDSLRRVAQGAGFEPLLLERSEYGGVLFCYAVPAPSPTIKLPKSSDWEKFNSFGIRAKNVMERFRNYAEPLMRSTTRSLGVYVPLRVAPYLCQLGISAGVRFFDDDPGVHRRYYDGFDIPIENIVDLGQHPVTDLLIASLAFGDRIREKVRQKHGDEIHIKLWRDLLTR